MRRGTRLQGCVNAASVARNKVCRGGRPLTRGPRGSQSAVVVDYDNNRVYAECNERNVAAVIPLRKKQPERAVRIDRASNEWRSLYRRRSAVEREFGNLKPNFGLALLRVRGIERVRLHADLCILARLALPLERARAVPLAA